MFRKYLLTALALVGSLAACDQGSSGPSEPGKISILLTDAPGDFERAVVTIEEIYLQGGGGSGEKGRTVLMEDPVTVDLLDLRNEAMELVEDVVIPGGNYSELRMVISGGYIEVIEAEDDDGNPTATRIYASSPQYAAEQGVSADGTLKMPSFAQSGLKIKLPGGAVRVDGDHSILLLDFNVAESFGREAGNSGMWVMDPVIHATDFETTAGVEFTLSLAEGVTLPTIDGKEITLADFQVALDKNGDVLTENFVSKADTFRVNFHFLEPGRTYPVDFIEPNGVNVLLDTEFPAEVGVTSGGTYRKSFKITQAAAK
jgi:hypothetical protein